MEDVEYVFSSREESLLAFYGLAFALIPAPFCIAGSQTTIHVLVIKSRMGRPFPPSLPLHTSNSLILAMRVAAAFECNWGP
jgi:hypothetical protein